MKKWKATLLSTALLLSLAVTSAHALEYTFDSPPTGDFGAPTSTEDIIQTGAEPANKDRSKSSALIPPDFGTPTSYLPGSGEYLTPNLAADGPLSGNYGQTLTASYAPSNGETVSYQWNRGGAVISGATGSTYTLTADDVGQKITVTATPTDTTNYTGSVTSSATAAVAKATPTVKVEVALGGSTGAREAVLTVTVTGVTGGAAPTGTVTLTCDNGLSQTLKLDGSGKATYTWSGLAEGDYTVTAEYGGDSSYDTARANKTFNTNKQEQDTLAISPVGNKTYGDQEFTLFTTGGSGFGAVTFTSSDPSVIGISRTTATIRKAGGPVTITATKAEDEHYNAATATLHWLIASFLRRHTISHRS